MAKPGFYRSIEGGEGGLGQSLSPKELLALPTGVRVIRHAHLRDDPFLQVVSRARGNGNVLEVIRQTRSGNLDGSDIVEPHTGHEEGIFFGAMNYFITLLAPTSNRLPRGREAGSRLTRRSEPVSWLREPERKKKKIRR